MPHSEEIVIPLSKTKLTLALIGSITFVVIGIWFVVAPPATNVSLLRNPVTLLIVGIVAILFFGLIGVLIAKKLKDDKPGLIINHEGINDNSGAINGLIKWDDLQEISVLKISGQKLIMLFVSNPQEYIDREANVLKRKTMQLNFKTYDSPLSLSANSLKCNFDELLLILNANFKKYKK